MTMEIESVPEDLKARGTKLREEPEDIETRQMLQRMIKNVMYEQTSKSLVDTLIMSDLEVTEFFDVLRSSWVNGGERMLTLLDTNMYHNFRRETWKFERAEFVGIREKLWCRGCGGVVTVIPEFCSLTLVHTWMNPICPALIGIRDPQRCVRGTEVARQPDISRPTIKAKIEELVASDFPIHARDMISETDRAASWGRYPSGQPVEKQNRMVTAGWYAQKHPTGKKARCFCCGVERVSWRPDDCPLLAHLKESPGCPYLHAIMDEEEIISLLAGHKDEIKKHPWKGFSAYDYFKKIIFPPQVVNHERISWNQRSTQLQKKSDTVKEKLIAEWIIYQRIDNSPPTESRAKRSRLALTREELMRNYQWSTRRVDINTKVQGLGLRGHESFQYTPNWQRDEKFLKGWGLLFPYNRSVTLTSDHLVLE